MDVSSWPERWLWDFWRLFLWVSLCFETKWQASEWHRHELLFSLLSLRVLFHEKGKIPLYFVFVMLLGFSPAGFYSLLLASQIRRMLAYFNSFLGFKQPLINSKLMFWNVTKIWETEHWDGLLSFQLLSAWSPIMGSEGEEWGRSLANS